MESWKEVNTVAEGKILQEEEDPRVKTRCIEMNSRTVALARNFDH